MERPSVDGGCGAVYPHGALHAPVRAPDGELEDGSEGKRGRCSSSTMAFPLAPCRDLCDIVASLWGEGGRGSRVRRYLRYFPLDMSKIMKKTRLFRLFFFFSLRRSISQRKRVFSLKRKRWLKCFIISFRIGFKEICWFVASKKRKRLYTHPYTSGYDIPDIRLTVDGIH